MQLEAQYSKHHLDNCLVCLCAPILFKKPDRSQQDMSFDKNKKGEVCNFARRNNDILKHYCLIRSGSLASRKIQGMQVLSLKDVEVRREAHEPTEHPYTGLCLEYVLHGITGLRFHVHIYGRAL